MGEIERKFSKRRRKQDIQTAVLGILAAGALISGALLAPNTIQEFAKLGIIGKRKKEGISRARDALIKKGFLRRDNNNYLHITDKGRIKLWTKYGIEKQIRWDSRWRVLIFDIPEKRKGTRTEIRRILSSVGFARLQDSVWVYPYKCEEFVALLKAEKRIGKDLLYMIVDSIENDKYLKENFELN